MVKQKILAVHDRDLKVFLESLGLLKRIENQELRCAYCECVITLDNIGFVFPSENRVKICCDKPPCYYKFSLKT